jgi:peptide/nickel transport system permease protein
MHLTRFVVRRAAFALQLMLAAASAGHELTRLAPGDATSELVASGLSRAAIARERARLEQDRPFAAQYVTYLRRAARFDFGTSLRYGRPVRDLIVDRASNTLLLGISALVVATLVGIPLGVWSGARATRPTGALIARASLVVLSVPSLLLSLLLVLVAARTGWFPIGGLPVETASTPALDRLAATLHHLALPVLAVALPIAAMLERVQSAAMHDTLSQPFVVAARARGIPERRLLWRSALRPAVRPVLALYGIVIGTLLSGSLAVEIVMSWPGLGRLFYEALVSRDIYLVAGCSAAAALVLAVGSAVSDLALAAADPRQRELDAPEA